MATLIAGGKYEYVDPKDGGCIFLPNVYVRLLHYTLSQSTRQVHLYYVRLRLQGICKLFLSCSMNNT